MAETRRARRLMRSIDEKVRRSSKDGLLIGMACNFAFVTQVFFAPAMTHVTPFMLSFTDMSYCFGALSAAFLLARMRAKTLRPCATVLWGLTGALALMFVLYSFLLPSVADIVSANAAANMLFLAGGALFGVYLAYVVPLWLRACAIHDPAEIVWTVLLAGLLGSVLVWFFADMGPTRLLAASLGALLLGTYLLSRASDAFVSDVDAPRRESGAPYASKRLFAACFLMAFAFVEAISFAEADGASLAYAAGTFFAPVLIACVCLLALRGLTVVSLLSMAVPIATVVVMSASFFRFDPVLSFDLAVAGMFLFLVYAVMAVFFSTYGSDRAAYGSFLMLAVSFAGGCVVGRVGSAFAVSCEPFSLNVAVLAAILAVVAALLLCVRMPACASPSPAASSPADPSADFLLEKRVDRAADAHALGRREKEALSLLLAGKTAGEIARIMVVAPGTAKSHVYHVYRKLGVHSRAELFEMFGLDG
ncbi:MAG: helix-turn-helix transcriptional regulator [Slackia piriformis]|uniref:Helix-turn-helix transcriptional regulator n=1 Tax=Slackia piriformis TaxID=626934 RepID=A0A943UZJ1_9ACTN|nr:helix-turn-helix transcriptional regulator [Slackia piriformis]